MLVRAQLQVCVAMLRSRPQQVDMQSRSHMQQSHRLPVAEGPHQAGPQPDQSLTALSLACKLQALCQSLRQ